MNQKRINRRIRCKKFLRQEIDKNHNIFQSRVNLSRNMVAQNILWDKNYSLKQAINQLHEENSSLKARIWNFEKENRKMDRQIEYWSLKEYMATTGKKIYIDTATLEKVLADQDYNIVSMKIDIVELEKTLSHLTKQLEMIQQQVAQADKHSACLNYEILQHQIQFQRQLDSKSDSKQLEIKRKEQINQLSLQILNKNQQLALLYRDIEIKMKSAKEAQKEFKQVSQECQVQKAITFEEIQRLNDQARKMKIEQDDALIQATQEAEEVQIALTDYECYMQERMSEFIRNKIALRQQIYNLKSNDQNEHVQQQ